MARPKANGPYTPLAVSYYRDDAILEAGEKAELMYVRGLAYCGEAQSDGFITDRQMVSIVGLGMRDAAKRADVLVRVGLWERVAGGYVVRSWLKWNRSTEEIGRRLKADRERKQNRADEDSARNPVGNSAESVPHVTSLHGT